MIRTFSLVFLLILMAPLMAQDASDNPEQQPGEPLDCIPPGEVEQSSDDESGPSQEDPSDLPICEEENAIEADPVSEPEIAEEDEVVPDEEEEFDPEPEFEPEEQISEDFPVPLPSDI